MVRDRLPTVVTTALLLTAATASASTPVVPARVQQEIKQRDAQLAFIPARLPVGYRYATWAASRVGYEIWFSKRGRPPRDLGYQALAASCSSLGKPMRTFELDGVRVYWSATYEDQQAWRCLRRGDAHVILSASRSVAGDDATSTPGQKRDALDLVRLVAYVRWIG